MNDIFVLPVINNDAVVLVDASIASKLIPFKWRYDPQNGYISSRRYIKWKSVHVYLHNSLLGVSRGGEHKNRNRLDNRSCNLRHATVSQNNINKAKELGLTSRFKGVFWNKINKNWNAQITYDGVRKHLGVFEDEVEAAKAYNRSAKNIYGDYAFLNDTDITS